MLEKLAALVRGGATGVGGPLAALAILSAWPAVADDPGQLDIDITGSSLEELFELDITTVSRRDERYQDTAAAVFVLTAEDLARTGVTSVPEALRLVPGVQVAKVDSSKWAVSIRGFNSRTSNKLLVMIDGRSVYNPLFAGVLWEIRDLMLEDVERIEVVRGPGGVLWGANAVNGVINIITRSADQTVSSLVSVGGGKEERAFGAVRHGWQIGRRAHARVYGKYFDRDAGHSPLGTESDDWAVARAGFRVDWKAGRDDHLTVQGDVYDGEVGEALSGGGSQDVDHSGGNVLFRWGRERRRVERALQVYYDRTKLDNLILGETRDTFDLGYQATHVVGPRHHLTWGLGYRYTADEISDGVGLAVDPDRRQDDLYSVFVQTDLRFPDRDARLQLGTKIERNDYTGSEVQPGIRFAWSPAVERTWWAKVSRAVRTPSRLEADITVPFAGIRDPRPETVIAHEIGLRWRGGPRVALDSTAFWNTYDHLLTLEGAELGAKMKGDAVGFETSLAVQLRPRWRFHTAYTWLRLDLDLDPDSLSPTPPEAIEGSDPRHQLVLRVTGDLEHAPINLDATLRHVGELAAAGVPSYTALDLAAGWRPTEHIDLSLVGRNLPRAHHAEQAGNTATEVESSIYLRLRLDF